MKVLGYVDRVTDEKYVTIIVEEQGLEYVENIKDVPENVTEGKWLNLTINDSDFGLENIEVNEEETQKRKERVKSKLERLRKRKGSKYKK